MTLQHRITTRYLQASTRADVAQEVAHGLTQALKLMWTSHLDPVEVSPNNTEIDGAYRSDLPKEGAMAVGEGAYDEMVQKEIARFRKVLERKLDPYKSQIASTSIEDGEKSWIYVHIELK